MKKKKFLKPSILISFFIIFLLSISACGTLIDNKQDSAEVKNRETQDKLDNKMEYPIYEVEDIDNLHLGSEEFNIINYFIRYESEDENLYYIDSNNILWGYGNNQYGQLGNGKKYIQQDQYDDSFEMTPQKIAENVIHVDFGGFFVIFLTESGDLYGVGANLNGVMGIDVSEKEDYFMNPSQNVVTKPVCLMKDVKYARAGLRGITALKNDGSVWWWGEVRTTSAINIEDTIGVCYTKPEKMLDGGIYVACGDFCAAAITEDGTLWTWGNNTFGSCGYDSGNEDFIEKPVKVLKDVKMVWMDEVKFDSLEERVNQGMLSPYKCNYSYVTFVEKKDGNLLACGLEVIGEESKSRSYKLYGDILRTADQMNGGIQYDPVTIIYSDVFQPIEFKQKDRQPQLKFKELTYGMPADKVMDFLYALEMKYKIVDGISDGEKVYNLVTKDQYFIFWFNDAKELIAISYNAYGTRNGKIKMGMTKEEVEKFLNDPFLEEISIDNNSYVTSFYKDNFIYEIGYYEGVSYYIKESMIDVNN